MSKIGFTLIFTLYIFNFIIQVNATEGTSTSESSSDVTQKLKSDQSSYTDAQKERIDLSDDKNAAFTIIQEYYKKDNSVETGLPSLIKNLEGKWSLSSAFTENTEEIHLCPDISVELKAMTLKAANDLTPATKSCLFTKKFKPNEPKICTNQPIPWLMVQKTIAPPPLMYTPLKINCNKKDQQLLAFQFNNCDGEAHFIEYAERAIRASNPDLPDKAKRQLSVEFVETDSYLMYEICFDIHTQKTLWTRHQVLTPMLFFEPAIQSRNIERIDYNTVGTSTYDLKFMKPDTFTKLTDIYTQNKLQNISGEYLVPMQHMALQNWKKSTYHLINVAPLREKFHLLMQIINEGLIMVSRYIFTEYGHNLEIFTTAETKIDKKENFLSNSWYKFIYYEDKKAGALIYIHNTEDEEYKRLSCDPKLTCHFNKWIKYKEDPRIPEDVLSHAGCCEVNAEVIKELFQMDVELSGIILNIQEIVAITKITDTRLQFIDEQDTSAAQNSESRESDAQLEEEDNPDHTVDKFVISNEGEKNNLDRTEVEEKN